MKEYGFRYWTKDGICWAKNSNVQDIDDTAMGFRVLRMHGYKVTTGQFLDDHLDRSGDWIKD